MFLTSKNNSLKILNSLFSRMGIKTNLFIVSKIYEKDWSNKSLQVILKELSINYDLTSKIKSIPCVVVNNNSAQVVLDVCDDKIRVWDPVKKRKKLIEKQDTYSYINIKYLNNSQLDIINIIHYIKEKYKFLFNNIILSILFIMLCCFKAILLTAIGYLCYMNLDYYFIFVNFTNMIHNMIICFLLLLVIIIVMNFSNVLITKIINEDNKKYISGEYNYFKLIDYCIVTLILAKIVYFNNRVIGLIMIIHMLGIIVINKNMINYNKVLKKNINFVYICLNLLLFITSVTTFLFNDLISYSYLVIPGIGYLYIYIYGFSVQKYYSRINIYIYNLKEELWKRVSNADIVSKIRLSEPMNMYLIGNSHVEIEKGKINLLFDKNEEKKIESIDCLKNNNDTSFKIYLGKEKIEEYSIESLRNKIFIINNTFQKNSFDYNSVYKRDLEEIDKILDLEGIYKKKFFSDTDLLILNVGQLILKNPFYLIFDNVLSRFNDEIINKVLNACKTFNITVVILEQKKLNNKYVDNVIDWTEEIK